MNNNVVPIKNEEKKELKPSDFPPILRKVLQYQAKKPHPVPFSEACEAVGIEPRSVYQAIWNAYRRGKNFYELWGDTIYKALLRGITEVDAETYKRALTGTHKDRELYYKRTKTPVFADPKHSVQVNVGLQFNTLCAPAARLSPEELAVEDDEIPS